MNPIDENRTTSTRLSEDPGTPSPPYGAEHKRPEEIERDIEHTRAELGETLDALHTKLSPAEIKNRAREFVRERAGGASSGIMNTIRNNPVPVALFGAAAAWLLGGKTARTVRRNPIPMAFVGMGGAWLLASGLMKQEARDYGEYDYYEGNYPERGAVEKAKESAVHLASTAGERIRDAAGKVRETVSSAVEGARHATSEMVDTAREKAARASESVGGSVGEMGRSVGEMRQSAAQRISERTGRYAGTVQDWRDRMSSGRASDEEILAVAGVGMLVGAALGALLPPSRLEHEYLGPYRDDVIGRTKSMGKEQLSRVSSAAQTVLQAAKDVGERGSTEGERKPSGREERRMPAAGAEPRGDEAKARPTEANIGLSAPAGASRAQAPRKPGEETEKEIVFHSEMDDQ
jgi:hypothetical protein